LYLFIFLPCWFFPTLKKRSKRATHRNDLSNDSRPNRQQEELLKFERRGEDRSTDDENSSWTGLTDFWLYFPYPDDSRQRFIDTLKTYYQGDTPKLKILDEFERNYNGKNAISGIHVKVFYIAL
jgi:hypothetical protein